VLLLNAVLTVERGAPQSHAKRGWETLTTALLAAVAARASTPTVFLLWGKPAEAGAAKAGVAASGMHTVLVAPHPSPLSAHRGFLGCRAFSRANAALVAHGVMPIDWRGGRVTAPPPVRVASGAAGEGGVAGAAGEAVAVAAVG
jgi:uracil-DNA glycosylase